MMMMMMMMMRRRRRKRSHEVTKSSRVSGKMPTDIPGFDLE